MKQKIATIIIPTYNESETIEKTIHVLSKVFKSGKIEKHWKMHVLVVDDSSPDGTGNIIKKLQKKYAFLHLKTNKEKAGLGGAYISGMEKAFEKIKSDVVFEFDADLSHDPKKIPMLLQKIDEGYDLVLGSRYIPGGSIPENWGWHRKAMSVFGNLLITLILTDFRVRDWSSGYRAIKKEVYEKVHKTLKSEKFSGYVFQIGSLYKTLQLGFKVAEVPFHFVDREAGKSKIGPEYIKDTLMFIFKARIHQILNNRIFKFAVVGGIGALIQLTSLTIYRNFIPFQLAFFLSIETSVVSNFIWSNLWTFSDRKLSLSQVPLKFIQFNLTSGGSILIQQIVAFIGEFGIGLFEVFTTPIIPITVDTGMIYAVVGILLGMFWNFFAYSTIIWKKK